MHVGATKSSCARDSSGAQLCGSLSGCSALAGPRRLARRNHPLRRVPGAAGAAQSVPQNGRNGGLCGNVTRLRREIERWVFSAVQFRGGRIEL